MISAYLKLQTRKINDYRTLRKPRMKQLAGLTIKVLPKVYPGGADSEAICKSMAISPGDSVLDLCTGTGIIALTASLKGARTVIGTDLNPDAIKNANQNKELMGLNNITFIEADMFPADKNTYDLVTINPPYTNRKAPDKTAICFWDKDNRVVKKFFQELSQHLKPKGKAYITWSDFADQDLLPQLAKLNGFVLKQVNSQDGLSGFTYFVYEVTDV